MHSFFNHNYVYGEWYRKVGVHHFHNRHTNCFTVKIPISVSPWSKTIGKYATKQEAEKVFLEHVPDWNGPVPYYETLSDKTFKSYK